MIRRTGLGRQEPSPQSHGQVHEPVVQADPAVVTTPPGPDAALTPWINTSAYGLRAAWNAVRRSAAVVGEQQGGIRLRVRETCRRLEYKSAAAGVLLAVADRWFAGSKTCSGCGTAKAESALSERTYVCMACGLVLGRDVNAALNLAALRPTPASCAGNCLTEAMSDRICLQVRQSHRHGKSP